jgi:(1->4)-alpha-D-glucan 1-alpha-D-glucosylmutase
MKIPTATYRLQFSHTFGFNQARVIASYLSELGISDIYASPVLKARKGSSHGYDNVAPDELNPELGTLEDFTKLAEEVKNCDLGWLQDIVPNHMACDSQNRMLMDVLESGKNSVYYHFFDIEWNHAYESIKGRLLIPFLGDYYSRALENGEIDLKYDENGFSINYFNSHFPLNIESYLNVLTYKINRVQKRLGNENPDFIKFLGILYVLKTLSSKEELEERFGQVKFVKNILWELYSGNEEFRKFIDKNLESFNGEPGNPKSYDMLDKLLTEQLYRLSYWKVASDEINYRRFFSVNELISLKVEEKEVFDYIHRYIFELIGAGKITGLRIDHIDGLNNPTKYLKDLRDQQGDIYTIVEKITELNEKLPEEWPIQGTTGYEYLNHLNGIFCETANEEKFSEIYLEFSGFHTDYEELIYQDKKIMIDNHMTGDIDNLAHLLKRISSRYRYGSDITLYGIKKALIEIMSYFPVYRTYIIPENFETADYTYTRKSVRKALARNPALYHELNFIEHFLTYSATDHFTDQEKEDRVQFIMRFQQFTGPLMAKGFEDTALYIYNRLISLNEVGGKPGKFGITLEEFHNFNSGRAKHYPNTLNATSTHDTKRGEDIRARLNVLSEIPAEWQKKIKYWSGLNKGLKKSFGKKKYPDCNDEYLLYQTIIGAFPYYENDYPDFIHRVKEYMIKAVREAKVYTEWIKPDSEYENACLDFLGGILTGFDESDFMKDLLAFQKKIAFYGAFNSLSQVLLKMTSPGVCDFYQGSELWDLSMVDPDNRRFVDFEKRKVYLEELKNKEKHNILMLLTELLNHKEDGKIKMFLVYRSLNLRREYPALFSFGEYIPLSVTGKFKNNVIAFARKHRKNYSITVAPRFYTQLIKEGEVTFGENAWQNTCIILPPDFPSDWTDIVTSQPLQCKGKISLNSALKHFPVALAVNRP